jgi:hypothetical protein
MILNPHCNFTAKIQQQTISVDIGINELSFLLDLDQL